MQVLAADDDPVIRAMVGLVLERGNYDVQLASNGSQAAELWLATRPQIVVTDWTMPEMDGDELCRLIRATATARYTYIILVTAKDSAQEVLDGLDAGADDYITKPFDARELLMRVNVGRRIVALESTLTAQINELQVALEQVRTLEGLLPICSYCKKVRQDDGYWREIEAYIGEHTDASFTHGYCPTCMEERVMPQIEELRRARGVEAEPASELRATGT
jgi:phosphoserine phosphatase RsbU/P